jgi:hypothetical protein
MLLSYGTKWAPGTAQAETVQFCTVVSRRLRQSSHRFTQIQWPAGPHRDRDSVEITVITTCCLACTAQCTAARSGPLRPSCSAVNQVGVLLLLLLLTAMT